MIKTTRLLTICLLLAAPVQAGNIQAGKAKAEACSDCHSDNGQGDRSNPSIAGMAPEAFIKAMQEYQSGLRGKSRKMAKAANQVSDADIADLAAYYATLAATTAGSTADVSDSGRDRNMSSVGMEHCRRRGGG